jgi:polysaccharide pyruvyl transferase CsaB
MKIALSGYYGFDNAGDEALLLAITSSIKAMAPEADFVVFSGNPSRTSASHGLPAVYHKNPWQVYRQLHSCDLLISGGGSIFQDITSAQSLWYYIGVVALAKLLGKPVMFYAQGVGPINLPLSKLLMRLVANRVNMISVRDHESANLLKQLGVANPPVLVTADPVFALQPNEDDQKRVAGILPDAPCIGVSVRHWAALEGYQAALVPVLDGLAEQGYRIIFLPMSWPEDVPESRRIMSLMQCPALLLDRSFNSGEMLALISRLEMMISMRLHALIFAATQGIPFAGISYDPKVESFLGQFALSPLPLDSAGMAAQIALLLENCELQQVVMRTAAQLHDRAQENAQMALALISPQKERVL